MMQPHWDSAEETDTSSQQNGGMSLAPERWHIKGLQVGGLPAWALQFQIGLLASRMGNSTRGMEAMENAFTSYETWLPRSCRDNDDGTPDVDTLRKEWYNGVPHWTAWIRHPRTWLDLGDIAYHQGAGCFHVAAEAYKGALERAGGLLPPKKQESIAYRIAKCYSRCGDNAGAIASVEQLLYTRNFWSDRYRARTMAATLRSVRDLREAIVHAHASKLMQNFKVICWKRWVHYHDLAKLGKAAAKIQALLRGVKARAMVQSLLAARNSQDLLDRLVKEMQRKGILRRCIRRLSKQVVVGRRERAATTIQAMARGVVGRELASDERNRRARISELLLNALRRLGTPVLRQWYTAAHDIRRVRMATKIQARWRTVRARQEWALTQKKVARARRMGIEAIGRNQLTDKRRTVETWKNVVLERKVVTVQGRARVWLAKRVASRRRKQRDESRTLFKRVMKPMYRQCFVALARNRTTCRKKKKVGAMVIQCWWRCHLAIGDTHRLREYRDATQNAYETVTSNRERRLLARCCSEWRENIQKQQAATKIQAAWRGWEGRLRATRFRDREARFEAFAEVLRAVYRRIVWKSAFEEWSMFAWLSKSITKVSARYRGNRTRSLFAQRMSILRAQQVL
ncbi:unnamed protein product [Hapterophycus canaliculatus]